MADRPLTDNQVRELLFRAHFALEDGRSRDVALTILRSGEPESAIGSLVLDAARFCVMDYASPVRIVLVRITALRCALVETADLDRLYPTMERPI